MYSNNPIIDNFGLVFTDDFFISDICEKYNNYLKQYNYPLMDIKDVLMESLQSVETPSFGYDMWEQNIQDKNMAGMTQGGIPSISEQKLAESKKVTLTFRHTDGFITYWFLFEHFVRRFMMGDNPNRKPFSSIILNTLSFDSQIMCRTYYNQCYIVGMPAILFAYNQPERNALQFNVEFYYNAFATSLEIPTTKIK